MFWRNKMDQEKRVGLLAPFYKSLKTYFSLFTSSKYLLNITCICLITFVLMTNFTLANIFFIKPQNQFQFFFLIVQHLRRHIHGMFFFSRQFFNFLKKKLKKLMKSNYFIVHIFTSEWKKIEFLDFYMNGRNFYWKILHKILLLPIIFIEDDLILLFSLQLLLYFLILNNRLFILFSKSK